MPWGKKIPDLTNNPLYLEPRVTKVESNLAEIVTFANDVVKWYGAIGDGQSHPLSSKYATLAQAQVVYPFATALTNEIDWCALQKAVNSGNHIAVYCDLVVDQAVTATKGKIKLFGHGSITLTNKNDDIFRITQTSGTIVEEIEVSGLKFIGNADKADTTPQRAIYLYYVNKVNIHDCTFQNFNTAIRLTNANDLQVHDNKFYDMVETSDNINGYGILFEGCKHQHVVDNQFYRMERHSIYLNGYESAVVDGNTFKGDPNYSAVSGYELPVKLTNGYGCTITGNNFKHTVGGIWIDTAFDGMTLGPEEVTITSNTFEDGLTNGSIVTGWIYLHGMYMKNIKISSNIMKNAYNHGIHYDGSGDVEIINNTIDGGQYGIQIDSTDANARIKISENEFKNLTTGVNVASANPLVFGRNNRFKSVTNVSNFSATYPNVCLLDNYDINQSDVKLINSGETTINVSLGNTFQVSNAAGTNVVGLSGQGKQQRVTLIFTNGNTILKNSSTFRMKSGADVTSTLGMVKVFIQQTMGNWWEI